MPEAGVCPCRPACRLPLLLGEYRLMPFRCRCCCCRLPIKRACGSQQDTEPCVCTSNCEETHIRLYNQAPEAPWMMHPCPCHDQPLQHNSQISPQALAAQHNCQKAIYTKFYESPNKVAALEHGTCRQLVSVPLDEQLARCPAN